MDKSVGAYVKLLLKKEILSVKFVILMIFMFCLCEAAYSGLPFYLASSDDTIGFWEMFAVFLGSERTILFYFTGLLFLLGGFPYSGDDISLYIIRGNKKQWIKSNIITILIATFIYYIEIAFIIIGIFIGHISFKNEWTSLFKGLQNTEIGSKVGQWLDIAIGYQQIAEKTPAKLCIMTLFIAILASVILELTVFLFSMYGKRRIGYIFCLLLIIGNLLLPDIDGFSWYFYVQEMNVINFVKQMLQGDESAIGITYVTKGIMDVMYLICINMWIFFSAKKKDWEPRND